MSSSANPYALPTQDPPTSVLYLDRDTEREQKRTRSRLAQRKHRERMKIEAASTGNQTTKTRETSRPMSSAASEQATPPWIQGPEIPTSAAGRATIISSEDSQRDNLHAPSSISAGSTNPMMAVPGKHPLGTLHEYINATEALLPMQSIQYTDEDLFDILQFEPSLANEVVLPRPPQSIHLDATKQFNHGVHAYSPTKRVLSRSRTTPVIPLHAGNRCGENVSQDELYSGNNCAWRNQRSSTSSLTLVQTSDASDIMQVEAPSPSSSAPGPTARPPPTPKTHPDFTSPTNLETRFEHILDAVNEAGFDSIDNMPHTTLHLAQATSRSRNLRRVLATLRESAVHWTSAEAQGYREEIVRSAETIYVEEVRDLRVAPTSPTAHWGSPPSSHASAASGAGAAADRVADKLQRLFMEDEHLGRQSTHEKRLLRQRIPETWSLLTELGRESELPQGQIAQVVHAFLRVLAGGRWVGAVVDG
ncbi:hypothetical protein MMC11_006643 [Xylographa trunciseda]|nr:hypothetical protein [Xylographa trunciseda]